MSQPCILVVDDAMDMRIYLKTLVQGMGFGVVVARDGTEGLAVVAKGVVSLVVLDIMMPGEGGIAMFRALRKRGALAHIPVMIHSAIPERLFGHYLAMEAQIGYALTSPEGYVEKPADPECLKETIKRVLSC